MSSSSPSNPAALDGKRILVVEDTSENMRLFRAILKLEGAHILEACDGATGVAEAQRELPDLILMDIQMPGMDGLTATRLLKSSEATANIPVIAVTASVMLGDLGKIREAGCDGYISKPIDPGTFAQQVIEQSVTTGQAAPLNS